ncbi:MAG: HAD-IB family phosphatase [Acidimicrobiia bacterium]|jgi:2,3-diketo-5-methylthio-1-phosphopentane phosphatase
MAALDLATASVFLDFDGTITSVDSGVHLLERLASPEWRAVSDAYERGEIGSRVCLLDEWDLLDPDEVTLRAVAREVEVDPDAAALVADLRAAGADVLVVSDGFGFYATEVSAALGVPVLTNTVDWATGRLEFPHEDRCCACSSCGVCKQAPIKDAKYAGRTTVLVGDGASDYKAALLADVVFAKGTLAEWCTRHGIPFVPFATLAEVRAALVSGAAATP